MAHAQAISIQGSNLSYHVEGEGMPLLLVHGWPFHGASFAPVADFLKNEFRCYRVDLPGLGESGFSDRTDFSFTGLAAILHEFTDKIIGSDFLCLAHNTGATVARFLALKNPRLRQLVLLNTEIPGHRPPWIELFQTLFALPGAEFLFGTLLRSEFFLRTPLAYGGCFENPGLINADFRKTYVTPLIEKPDRMLGAIRYLRGIDFPLMDTLRQRHGELKIPVGFIWGENDPTFPANEGEKMISQFTNSTGFHRVTGTRLMLHLEKPSEVAAIAKKLFRNNI